MGALVASVLGVIVTVGFSKMLVNLSGEVTELKKEANQIGLVNKMSGLLSDCQPILSKSIDANNLQRGEEIVFSDLKDGNGRTILYVGEDQSRSSEKERAKKMYGLEGHTAFKLSCLDADCDCSSSQPCSRNWILSLFTMSYKNNLPMYKEVLNQGLRITYNTSDVADFTCNFGRRLSTAPLCTGGRTLAGSTCVCPTSQVWWEEESRCLSCSDIKGVIRDKLISSFVDFNTSCCTGGRAWDGSDCVCPPARRWNGSTCACYDRGCSIRDGDRCCSRIDPNWRPGDTSPRRICSCPGGGQTWDGNACVCPSGLIWDGINCVCPIGDPDCIPQITSVIGC